MIEQRKAQSGDQVANDGGPQGAFVEPGYEEVVQIPISIQRPAADSDRLEQDNL